MDQKEAELKNYYGVLIERGKMKSCRLNEKEIKLIYENFNLSDGTESELSFWIIGRPAAGKTTIATMLCEYLKLHNHHVELIDGDAIRSILNGCSGYSPIDRLSVFKKYISINQLFQERGIIPVTATVCGFKEFRSIVRAEVKKPIMIYLDCNFETAAQRDQKGTYAKAIEGKVNNFFGVDIEYEIPEKYDLKIDSGQYNPKEIIQMIIDFINNSGCLDTNKQKENDTSRA